MTVPSSRSVPRVLPVRSTGPETSSTSSSSWKARPMRRANAPSASARAALAIVRDQRPQAARGLEQRGRLQLAAAQVALDRDARGVGVLALQQLARGERRAGVRERAQLGRVAVARELGEGAREEQVAGRDRGLASGGRDDRGASAPQLGPVDHVVVDERRGVHELDRRRRAHQGLLLARPPLAHSGGGLGRQARRAAGAGACPRPRRWRWRARRAAPPRPRSRAPDAPRCGPSARAGPGRRGA